MNNSYGKNCNPHMLIAICFAAMMTIGCLPPAATFWKIEGDLTGLNVGEAVNLELNGGEQVLPLFANGHFSFPVEVQNGSAYAITATDAPIGRSCTVTGGSNLDGTGTINGSTVTDIVVECADILIADVYIPDQGLRDCIDDIALAADPDLLYVAEVTALDCDGDIYPIAVTTGLEVFTALTDLAIYDNTLLNAIDLSALANLVNLQLILSNLSSIDVSNNTALVELYLQLNFLTTINLDSNLALADVQIELNCWDQTTKDYLSGLTYSSFSYLPNRLDCL